MIFIYYLLYFLIPKTPIIKPNPAAIGIVFEESSPVFGRIEFCVKLLFKDSSFSTLILPLEVSWLFLTLYFSSTTCITSFGFEFKSLLNVVIFSCSFILFVVLSSFLASNEISFVLYFSSLSVVLLKSTIANKLK